MISRSNFVGGLLSLLLVSTGCEEQALNQRTAVPLEAPTERLTTSGPTDQLAATSTPNDRPVATSAPSTLSSKELPLRYVFSPKLASVRLSRAKKAKLLGRVLAGARLPVYEEQAEKGSGCKGLWLRIQYNGWICGDKLLPATEGEETEQHYENRFPMQEATVLQDTPTYAQPETESTGTELAGSVVKVIRVFELNGKTYAQLTADAFVSAEALQYHGRGKNSLLQGTHFDGVTRPPFVFFVAKKTPLFVEAGPTKGQEATGHQARYDGAEILESANIKGKLYLRVAGGWFKKKGVAIVSEEKRPAKIPEDGHWVLIDLSERTLSAYEGDKLVFATLVSPGREGHNGAFRTVKGTFRIQSKSRYTTMRGSPFGKHYEVKDVPWTQYFYRGYGLHGTFWHDRFGATASHGCVNLSAQDAKFLSDFLAPALPPGWLALYPPAKMDTSMIVVRK